MTNQTQQWYTLYTKPKAEYKVATALEQAGLEIFLPEIYTGKKDKTIKTPFFPCYLFMAANLDEVNSSVWKWTPGLRYIVTNDSQPVHLPPEVIRLIRAKLVELNSKVENSSTAFENFFKPGDSVRITNGPLSDMAAIFEGPTKPGRRVHVLLTILEHQRRVRLSAVDIEKISEPIQSPKKRQRRTRGHGRRIDN